MKTRGGWAVSWQGVRTVAVLELRQRVRSTRWIVALVVWFLVVGAITGLTFAAFHSDLVGAPVSDGTAGTPPWIGRTIFGLVVFFVLGLGLLVSPTLSATAINGDRAAGTLATLQVTSLSAAEIAFGKLLASWVAALAFLAVSVPFVVIAMTAGGVSAVAVVSTLALLAIILAAVCAIGLGFSALTARTPASAVLTYITVATLTVLSLIVFGLTVPAISTEDQVLVYDGSTTATWDQGNQPCAWRVQMMKQAHTERTWWLLAINPFVVVADAMPESAISAAGTFPSDQDPMSIIRRGVREARTGPSYEQNRCWSNTAVGSSDRPLDRRPVWPWGLAFNLLLGAVGVWFAVRRLRIPQRNLARGTRVA
jgi:ABC-type transport system involved in multi-copper enzyme maturation permease subunit